MKQVHLQFNRVTLRLERAGSVVRTQAGALGTGTRMDNEAGSLAVESGPFSIISVRPLR